MASTVLISQIQWDKRSWIQVNTVVKICIKLNITVYRKKSMYCHLVYLTYMQSTSFDMLGCLTHKLESRLLGQTSTTWYADDTTLMAEREEELNSLLMKVKEESEKTGLKLNIQKTKIVASSPITSWQIDAETMRKQWLHFLGLQSLWTITAATKLNDTCPLEEKLWSISTSY